MKKLLSIVLLALFAAVPLIALAEEMPDWYPADPGSWTFAPAGDSAPRVVDDADIFTDAEEASIEARIKSASRACGADIVIFTDLSSHGLDVSVYAADFYDFNGYGIGEEHNGFCLFLLMDPADRQGFCCVTGTVPRQLYTEENANALDDVLYGYLGAGLYSTGVLEWIDGIETLMTKGVPYAPDWFPALDDNIVRTHNSSAKRVINSANVLDNESVDEFEETARAISDKYGVDVVLLFDGSVGSFSPSSYAETYYYVKGYGLGDNYDCIFALFDTAYDTVNLYAFGNAGQKISAENLAKLEDVVEDAAGFGSFYTAGSRFLKYLDRTLKTGRVPVTPGKWVFRCIASGIIALIVSSIVVSNAKRRMKTVRLAYSANDHLDPNSFSLQSVEDTYLNSAITRSYSPVNKDGGTRGGGSSGRSSYSGGYHSSSGSSHSGSGRRF